MPDNYDNLKKTLQGLLQQKQADKAKEEEQRRIRNEQDRNALLATISKDLLSKLEPFLNELSKNSRLNAIELRDALKSAINLNIPKIDPPQIPEIRIPEIKVPRAEVKVTIPPIKIPDIVMPNQMDIKGWVGIMGFDKSLLNNPLPVQLMDGKGNPLKLFENLTQVISSGGGGARRVKIDNTATEPIPIAGTISATFSADFGVGEVGSETLRTVQASDAVSSSFITGFLDSSIVYEVYTTNKTAKSDGADIRPKADDKGRVLTRMQYRGLLATAYVSITNGTEATLLAAGGTGVFHDLIYLMGTNNSDAAVSVDIRDVTGGSVIDTIRIPANGTAGVSLPVPKPQGNANNNWTADLPDITGTTVTLSGLFSKET